MYLRKLSMRNYRNHSGTDIHFLPGTNVLYGNNGEGKTNILEAIYYLASGRSHIGSRDGELIQWGASSFSIHGEVEKRNRRTEYDVHYTENGQKRIRINKKDIHRLSELIGQFYAVMFSPETMRIIQGSPSDRRKYLDFAASQSSSQYFYYLQLYHKILTQRNELLKTSLQHKEFNDNLKVWDQQLIEAGSEVVKRRSEFVNDLESVVIPIHQHISRRTEVLKLQYRSSIGDTDGLTTSEVRNVFTGKLKKVSRIEKIRGYTMVGPHRDDMVVFSNGNDLHKFGSQGQQRTGALTLKLGEMRMLHQQTGEKPILLLDDVMSELDDERRTFLLEIINGTYQTIITSTNLNPFHGVDSESLPVFKVSAGHVERCD